MKATTKVRLLTNASWVFGIGTYLMLRDEVVLSVPMYSIILLGGTTIATFIFGIVEAFPETEEEEETEESCIGFTYEPEEDDND